MTSTAEALAVLEATATKLTVLYDERCAFCRRCRDWLLGQRCLVQVEILPSGSRDATERYGLIPGFGVDLVAIDDRGRAWVGPAAFVACLWATARYRPWAFRLARPAFAPHTERFFRFVSTRRDRFGAWFERDDPECSRCDELRAGWDR
jgi:predicted DCC family thiol-disulfide oxidoreductase YuxK